MSLSSASYHLSNHFVKTSVFLLLACDYYLKCALVLISNIVYIHMYISNSSKSSWGSSIFSYKWGLKPKIWELLKQRNPFSGFTYNLSIKEQNFCTILENISLKLWDSLDLETKCKGIYSLYSRCRWQAERNIRRHCSCVIISRSELQMLTALPLEREQIRPREVQEHTYLYFWILFDEYFIHLTWRFWFGLNINNSIHPLRSFTHAQSCIKYCKRKLHAPITHIYLRHCLCYITYYKFVLSFSPKVKINHTFSL